MCAFISTVIYMFDLHSYHWKSLFFYNWVHWPVLGIFNMFSSTSRPPPEFTKLQRWDVKHREEMKTVCELWQSGPRCSNLHAHGHRYGVHTRWQFASMAESVCDCTIFSQLQREWGQKLLISVLILKNELIHFNLEAW